MLNLRYRFQLLFAASLLLPCAAGAQNRPRITGVSHLCVFTTDAPAAEHFCAHDLGATKRKDPENPAGARYYFNPIQFVEVLPLPTGDIRTERFDHAAFNTNDAEGLRKYLAAHNVPVPAALTNASDGSRYFEVLDPEDNRIQFVQPPLHPVSVPINTLSHHMIHVGFMVHNAAVEDSFYHDLLGFRPFWHGGGKENVTNWVSNQVPDGLDWMEYMLVTGPEKKGVPAHITREGAGSSDHFALGIPNAEAAMELLYSGDRLQNKHSDPKIGRDGKWQINLFDPDGTRAELMEFRVAAKPCCSPFMGVGPTH